MEDLISIIIPVYNVEKYIERCIESVINQTYKNLEIILVDDGSPDNSGKICDDYAKKDSRIKVIHKENGGVSSARNFGLENARGEYISFIDSDDWVEENYIEKMLKAITENNAECVGCGYNRVYEDKKEKIVENSSYLLTKKEFMNKILLVQSGLGFCHMKLWKKFVLENCRFDENLKVSEDALFCIQASEKVNNFCMINEALYNYRFNSNSLVRKFDENYVEKYLNGMKEMKKYIFLKYSNNSDMILKLNNYIVYHVLLIMINYCFNPQNNEKGIKSLKKVCNIFEFKEAIKKSNYEGLSLTRKISLITLKYKLYFVSMLIGKIRQAQFKKI